MGRMTPQKLRERREARKNALKTETSSTPRRVGSRRAQVKQDSQKRLTERANKAAQEREENAAKRAARPRTGQGGRPLGSTTRRGGSTTSKSTTSKSKGGVTINGKPPTAIQKKLLKGGWTAKELEAKINARKKK